MPTAAQRADGTGGLHSGRLPSIPAAKLSSPRPRVQRLADGEQVAPGEPLGDRVPQQISRMQRGHGADAAIAQPFAAQLHDALGGAGELLGRGVAQKYQQIRHQQLDLPLDEGLAELDLLGEGVRLPGGRQNTRLVM